MLAEQIKTMSVARLHPAIGAEIGGVDLSRPLDAETLRQIAELRQIYGLDLKAADSHRLRERAR